MGQMSSKSPEGNFLPRKNAFFRFEIDEEFVPLQPSKVQHKLEGEYI